MSDKMQEVCLNLQLPIGSYPTQHRIADPATNRTDDCTNVEVYWIPKGFSESKLETIFKKELVRWEDSRYEVVADDLSRLWVTEFDQKKAIGSIVWGLISGRWGKLHVKTVHKGARFHVHLIL